MANNANKPPEQEVPVEAPKTKKIRNFGPQHIEFALADKMYKLLPGQEVEVPAELELPRTLKIEEVK